MDAIERQVPQVKRKNSTKCSLPVARFIVVGSVAWRSGPREVATGGASTGTVTVHSAEGRATTSKVGEGTPAMGVALGSIETVDEGCSTESVAEGAQAVTRKAEKRMEVRIWWAFMVIFVREVITEKPYGKINKRSGVEQGLHSPHETQRPF